MTDRDGPPLTNAEWDRLFSHERRKLAKAEAQIAEYEHAIRVLSDQLVATHEELAALKAGVFPEVPFVG